MRFRAVSLAATTLLVAGCPSPAPPLDLLLRGATVVDGSGAPARVADVAVRAGLIAAVGEVAGLRATREIDARGLCVAPGFIDLHSHADLILLGDRATQEHLLAAKILQGVTTVIVGNCGLGVAPASPEAAILLAPLNAWMTPDGTAAGAGTVAEYLARLERGGVALNVGTLVPHGPLRLTALGLGTGPPTAAARAAMRRELRAGLSDGAFGLSVGLIYPPGMFSDTDELVELAREVAVSDRLFTCHVRGSSELLLPATRELIAIGERSGARVHHSHLEAVGQRFWPDVARVLELEDEARRSGVRISHDVFLYTQAATMMSAIFPPWALEGGLERLLARLADPDARRRIASEIEHRAPSWPPWVTGGWPHNLVLAVGWDGIRVASVGSAENAGLVGQRVAHIAASRGRDPFDVVADLMRAEGGRVGQLVDQISGTDERMETLLSIFAHPAAAVVSDAEDYGRGVPHPAHAGAFARALRLARDRRLLPLEQVVQRMTSRPAELLHLTGRGVLRPGASADLVIFDPARVADRASWDEPRLPAEGVRWVLINGQIVVDDGRYVGGLAGQVLRAG